MPNIHPEKHNILVFLSHTLFPPFSHFQKMGVTWELLGSYLGVTWEERFCFTFVSFCFPIVSKRNLASSFSLHSLIFRTVLVSPSLRLCFPIDAKAKFYRCQSEGKAKVKRSSIEHLSKTYRRPIEHLSKTYRRRGEEGAEREQRGSRGRIWLQSYKIPKSHFHLFGR